MRMEKAFKNRRKGKKSEVNGSAELYVNESVAGGKAALSRQLITVRGSRFAGQVLHFPKQDVINQSPSLTIFLEPRHLESTDGFPGPSTTDYNSLQLPLKSLFSLSPSLRNHRRDIAINKG